MSDSIEPSAETDLGRLCAELLDLWSGILKDNGRVMWNLSVLSYAQTIHSQLEDLDGVALNPYELIRYVLVALPPAAYSHAPTRAQALRDQLSDMVGGAV